METNNLTEQEIKDLIIKFNLDESINDLKKYYATPTTWEIIKQARHETCHTQFIAWLLNNGDFNANPDVGSLKKLIVLLLKWSKNQPESFYDKKLAESIYNLNLKIKSWEVRPEYSINIKQTQPPYGQGNIDIFITCAVMIADKERTVHIVIENKVGASETIKEVDEKGNKWDKSNPKGKRTKLYQTEAYYQYVTNTYPNDINLFVFLKPTICDLRDITTAECRCKKYIQINYQELLDNIIQPICNQDDISEENRFRLRDYIKTLGKPSETIDGEEDNGNKSLNSINRQKIIMAMEQKERDLLKVFFENNEMLIRAAITSLNDPELTQSLAGVDSKGQRANNRYTINGNDSYTMYEVLEKFVIFRLANPTVSVSQINKEIANFLNTKHVIVSDDQNIKVYREVEGKYGTFTYNDKEIRYMTQWADKGDKTPFAKFRTKVSNMYPNFKIEKIN